MAFSGAKEQYDRAALFIKELCDVTGLSKEDVFVVPGNHDKNWYAGGKEYRELINQRVTELKAPDEALADWLQKDLRSSSLLFSPFRNYDRFAERYGCAEPLMHRVNNEKMDGETKYEERVDKMYWTDELAEMGEYEIHIYGLNSALYSDKEDYDNTDERKDGHKMLLSKLAYNDATIQDGVVNVVMMHHPMPYIKGGEKLKDELDKLYHVQIYGHVHVSKSDNENNRVHIFSGAMQPDEMGTGKEYRPLYNVIELDIENVDAKHDKLKVELQERCWNGTTFCKYREKQTYEVTLYKNNWEGEDMIQTANLPEGVTKHAVRVRLINNSRAKRIIAELAPGFYDDAQPKYYNVMRFLEKVRQENRWSELWQAMEK